MKTYQAHDAIIEDRNGYRFSIWFSYINGKLWFVEYTDGSPLHLRRRTFQEAV